MPFRGERYPLLPLRALGYVGALVLLLLITCTALELGLAALERRGLINTTSWSLEDRRIDRNNYKKVLADDADPVWRSRGFPVSETPLTHRRILVLGDSFAWGNGYLNMNDIWWRQLQRELDHRGYWDLQVIAAGLGGASTQDELRWLRDGKVASRYHADAVVIGYVTNDPEEREPGTKRRLVAMPIPEARSAVTAHVFLKRWLPRLFPRLYEQLCDQLMRMRQAFVSGHSESSEGEWETRLLQGRNFEEYRRTVAGLGEFRRTLSIPLLLFTLPSFPSREYHAAKYAPVVPLFEQAGIPFHSCLDALCRGHELGIAPLAWGISPANAHPGPFLTHFYAEQLADVLEREHRGLLGPRSNPPSSLRPRINDWSPPDVEPSETSPGMWSLHWPADRDAMPRMPLGKRQLVLCFELPVAIRSLDLKGAGPLRGKAYATSVDPDRRYDDGALHPLGERSGEALSWSIAEEGCARSVNTLRLVLDEDASPGLARSRKLSLQIEFQVPPVRP